MEFEEWIEQLKGEAKKFNWPIASPDAWREMFDDGLSPREALLEAMTE